MIRGQGPSRAIAFAAVLLAGLVAGCAPSQQESDYLASRARLERQNQGLRELIAEAERGELIPKDRFLVGIDEHVVAGLLRTQLPFEHALGKRLVVKLDSATVLLRDKYGIVTLDGEVHRAKTPDRHTAVRVTGGLGAVRIDPVTDLLSIDIAIDDFQLLQAGILDDVLGRGGKKLVSRRGREVLQDALPTLNVPVALAQQIRIPAVLNGPVRLDSLSVPINLSVERVLAAGGKLWLTLDAKVGKVTGAEHGVGIAVKQKPKKGAVKKGAGS